ncbi:unnamed protein product [Heligmosomoides polygyrus]|uniref:Uncharacterized protein n=1 Tax=Heligmosomoides polygyrus TaxID=6339 RepID=A0A3P7U1A6_HELPZ|nr:unnamed protein product [Heligmosomoides polygyrus]
MDPTDFTWARMAVLLSKTMRTEPTTPEQIGRRE